MLLLYHNPHDFSIGPIPENYPHTPYRRRRNHCPRLRFLLCPRQQIRNRQMRPLVQEIHIIRTRSLVNDRVK